MARSAFQTWLGGGLHLSLEIARCGGERLVYYLWLPRPLSETVKDIFAWFEEAGMLEAK